MNACIDCVAEGVKTRRATPYGGPRSPRCTTHYHAWRKRQRAKAHARHVEKGYGITGEQYAAIYASQGGKCYICQRATGKTKALAVDHDHNREGCLHAPDVGCPMCVRALLCGPCNQVIGRLGVEALGRAILVLTTLPAQQVLERLA